MVCWGHVASGPIPLPAGWDDAQAGAGGWVSVMDSARASALQNGRSYLLFLFDDEGTANADSLDATLPIHARRGNVIVPTTDVTVQDLGPSDESLHLLANPYNQPFNLTSLEDEQGDGLGHSGAFSSTVQIWDDGDTSGEGSATQGVREPLLSGRPQPRAASRTGSVRSVAKLVEGLLRGVVDGEGVYALGESRYRRAGLPRDGGVRLLQQAAVEEKRAPEAGAGLFGLVALAVRLSLHVQEAGQRLGGLRHKAPVVFAHGEQRLGRQRSQVGGRAVEVNLEGLVDLVEHGLGPARLARGDDLRQGLSQLADLAHEHVTLNHGKSGSMSK